MLGIPNRNVNPHIRCRSMGPIRYVRLELHKVCSCQLTPRTCRNWRCLIGSLPVMDWHPQQESNLYLILRRNLFYPIELWGHLFDILFPTIKYCKMVFVSV